MELFINTPSEKTCKLCSSDLIIPSVFIDSFIQEIPLGLDRDNHERVFLHYCESCDTVNIENDLRRDSTRILYEENSTCFSSSKNTFKFSEKYEPYSTCILNTKYKKYWKNLKGLDFGCGGGYFTRKLKDYLLEVQGADLDKKSIGFVSKKLKIKTFLWDINDIPDKKYDLISLIGVFEHLNDPTISMSTLVKKLNNRGYLIIAFPNLNSLSRIISEMSKHKWDMFLEPGHLFIPSKKGFVNLCHVNNLNVIDYYTSSHIIRGKIISPSRYASLEKSVLNLFLSSTIFRQIYTSIFKLLDFLKLGDISIYVLKKNEIF